MKEEKTNKIDETVENVMNEVRGSKVMAQVKKFIISLVVGFLFLFVGVIIGMVIMKAIGVHEDYANIVGIFLAIFGFLWYFKKK
ncbi:MAG: hypothetical protein PHD42_02635 [Dysgonamonadaceae bacterium]|nr:hypothetical protein [Dysgonamonadaceae bacterium]